MAWIATRRDKLSHDLYELENVRNEILLYIHTKVCVCLYVHSPYFSYPNFAPDFTQKKRRKGRSKEIKKQ